MCLMILMAMPRHTIFEFDKNPLHRILHSYAKSQSTKNLHPIQNRRLQRILHPIRNQRPSKRFGNNVYVTLHVKIKTIQNAVYHQYYLLKDVK